MKLFLTLKIKHKITDDNCSYSLKCLISMNFLISVLNDDIIIIFDVREYF